MGVPAGPLVSVLMPVRNEEAAVESALDSVLVQSHRNLEVLVADAESDDRTREIVMAYAGRDARVRLLRNDRRIIPAGLNVALAAARGDYVMRVDGHWTINPTYVETGLRLLEENPGVAVVGGRRDAVSTTSTGQAIACALSSKFGVGNSLYHHGTRRQDTDHASGGIYRADVVRAVGGWDERLPVNEDVDIDHRILARGKRILFEPTMVSRWRGRENLLDLGHQYRRYGRGKAQMLRKNGAAAIRARHLVAPAVVVTLAVSAVATLTGRRRAALVLGTPYPAAVVIVTAQTRRRSSSPPPSALALGGAFVTMHLSWGVGLLEGLLRDAPPATGSARETSELS